jgi:hypothetical protein
MILHCCWHSFVSFEDKGRMVDKIQGSRARSRRSQSSSWSFVALKTRISNLQVLHCQWLNFHSRVMILEEFCTIQWSTMEWRLLHNLECYIVPLFPWVMQPGVGWWLESHHQNLHKSEYSETVSHLFCTEQSSFPEKRMLIMYTARSNYS